MQCMYLIMNFLETRIFLFCFPSNVLFFNSNFIDCAVLYYLLLYCSVLYYLLLYCSVLYCHVLCCTVMQCTAIYCTVLLLDYKRIENLNSKFQVVKLFINFLVFQGFNLFYIFNPGDEKQTQKVTKSKINLRNISTYLVIK